MERNMGVKPDFKISECTKDGVYINIEHITVITSIIFSTRNFFLKCGNIKLTVSIQHVGSGCPFLRKRSLGNVTWV